MRRNIINGSVTISNFNGMLSESSNVALGARDMADPSTTTTEQSRCLLNCRSLWRNCDSPVLCATRCSKPQASRASARGEGADGGFWLEPDGILPRIVRLLSILQERSKDMFG